MIITLTIIAGALGALARYLIDAEAKSRWSMTIPWATVAINITGSLLLGILAGAVIFADAATSWQTVLGTGFCGGYTTFSTASVETVRLAQVGHYRASLVNLVLTLGLSLAACSAGLGIASTF